MVFKKTSSSAFPDNRLVLWSSITPPAVLKICSEGTLVGGALRNFPTLKDKSEKLAWLTFHHAKISSLILIFGKDIYLSSSVLISFGTMLDSGIFISGYEIFGADKCDIFDATSDLISSMLPCNNRSFIFRCICYDLNILTWTWDLKMLQQYNLILF